MLLAQVLSKHFKMIDSRLNTFAGIIKAFILCRGVQFKQMSEEIKGDIKLDSKIKSISRFLNGNHIGSKQFYKFIKYYIPQEAKIVSIDRTTWEMGKEIRNVLTLAISFDGIAMPVAFKIIPYKGSCTAFDQIELLESFIQEYGIEKIKALVGDREFDNEKLITYLDSKNIAYALRVRKTNRIEDTSGNMVSIRTLGNKSVRNFLTKFYSVKVKFDHIITTTGDYLSVVSSRNLADALTVYKMRWDIETTFKGCKTGGFRIEDTHVKNSVRFENLIKCLFIAYAIVIRIGDYASKINPIKVKQTLVCKAYSILQFGIRLIKEAYSKSKKEFWALIKYYLKLPPTKPNIIFVR